MVATGVLMLGVSWLALWKMRRDRTPSKTLSRVVVGMTFSGWIGVLSGWYTTEIGRQPFLVHGVLKTEEALGPIAAGTVMTTLVAWLLLYAFLVTAYIRVLFYMARKAGDREASAADVSPRYAPVKGGGPAGQAVTHA